MFSANSMVAIFSASDAATSDLISAVASSTEDRVFVFFDQSVQILLLGVIGEVEELAERPVS